MRIRTSLIGLTLAVAACHSAGAASHAFTVRDSAGVRIAESRVPAWAKGAGWRLAAAPSVDIGKVEGDPHYLFSSIRGGVLVPGGGFIVGDGSETLRGYSPTGVFQWTAGGAGEGPGEFKGLSSVELARGDSVAAFDSGLGRVSIFTVDGTFARFAPLQRAGMNAGKAIPLPDDGFVVVATLGSSAALPYPPPNGLLREKDPAVRFTATGDSVGTIGVFPGMDWFVSSDPLELAVAPFARFTRYTVRDSTLLVGTSDDMSISAYGLDGTLEQIIRATGVDLKITDAEVQAMRKMFLDRQPTPQARKRERARLRKMPIPPRRPAYSDLQVDPQGDLWVGGYRFPGVSDTTWSVFAQDGRLLGKVPFPSQLRVLDIDSTSVLGVWTDSLTVEHVRVYGIERQAAPRPTATDSRRARPATSTTAADATKGGRTK